MRLRLKGIEQRRSFNKCLTGVPEKIRTNGGKSIIKGIMSRECSRIKNLNSQSATYTPNKAYKIEFTFRHQHTSYWNWRTPEAKRKP